MTDYLKELIWIPRFKSHMSTPNAKLQTYWQKQISHVMNGAIFLHLLNIIHFSSQYWYQNSSSTSCVNTMTKRTREQEGEEKDRDKVKVDNDDSDLHCLYMFSGYAESDCVEKSGDTQGTLSELMIRQVQEPWSKKIQSRRSVESSWMAKRCRFGMKVRGDASLQETQK